MMQDIDNITLKTVANQFLGQLPKDVARAYKLEVTLFVDWFDEKKTVVNLAAIEVASYAERFSNEAQDEQKLEILRRFLTFVKESGYTTVPLSASVKAHRAIALTNTKEVRKKSQSDRNVLTQKGYDDLLRERDNLLKQRPQVLEEIRRAAADKDFRENAPLHAAREQLGYIDGRIQELEQVIRNAAIISSDKHSQGCVCVGNTVTLVMQSTGKTLCYTIVGPKEANPSQGKISHVSPIGQAIIGHHEGEVVEVIVPSGIVRYRIEHINIS
ncbi:MAG: transcription elongation factor GreA [Dehalococcoidia bacterium]|nr:transcription elongation factor GreA [Dehalococcoidia bacterium]